MAKSPVIYSDEVADHICRELAKGRTLKDVCRGDGMPDESSVRQWVVDREGFAPRYAQAREAGVHAMADEIVEIAEDGSNDWMEGKHGPQLNAEHVQRSRLRVDTRKWLMAKALPKVYGDKLELSGKMEITDVTDEALDAKLAALLAKAKGGGSE